MSGGSWTPMSCRSWMRFSAEALPAKICCVARTLIDFEVMLGEQEGRMLVLSLIPEQKQTKLKDPVGRSIQSVGVGDWTERK